MQLTLFTVMGLGTGALLFTATRKHAVAAARVALTLGLVGSLVFLGSINGWLLPDLGRMGMVVVGVLSGAATALSVGCLVNGHRERLNWGALAAAVPPIIFLVAIGIGELLGPAH